MVDDQLTVATGNQVFPPWMLGDDPTNEKGFESGIVYAVAEEMGIEAVEWVTTGFDEALAPGPKDYDFNIQQYSITAKRDEQVDFSRGYYKVKQALVATNDGQVASATSLTDLQALRLGAALGTTSLDYIDSIIKPTEDAQEYDDNAAAKAAFEAGNVDGIVFDLPTAYFITQEEVPSASIVGVLPVSDIPEEFGMLFAEGSPLVPCVNAALDTLEADGTLGELEQRWLNDDGNIPTLSK